MRHEVPQFIDIEDKILGPFTFMQGLYLIGGFFGGFAIFYLLGKFIPTTPFVVKAALGMPILAFGSALGFLKVNKRPFTKYLEAWFYFLISPKKYIWKKQENSQKRDIEIDDDFTLPGESGNKNYTMSEEYSTVRDKRSRLKTLANSLDMDY